jgi:Uma2 family endonuclease
MSIATTTSAPPGPTPIRAPVESPAAVESASPAPSFVPPADRLYRLSLEEYHRLAEAGVLSDTRVELIEGLLVKKMTKHTPPIIATVLVDEVLQRLKPEGWFVTMGNPITLAESASEPEPDAKLVRGSPRDYAGRRITPADVGLAIEVSDSSLRDDQVMKKALYARSSVPVYWIVNIPDRRVEVYTEPTGPDSSPDYCRRDDYPSGADIPLVLDGVEVARIAVADLLP